jgi:hypothetical protein
MIMLDKGRVLMDGARAEFETIRDSAPDDLATHDEQLIHQFLNGAIRGPLTDAEGTSEYEKWMTAGRG